MEMNNQIAVVTGAAQGIGLAVSTLLALRGVRVVGWDIDPETHNCNGGPTKARHGDFL